MTEFPNLASLIYLANERLAIERRRASGASPPWTEDELLATYRFCHTNVQHDRVSRVIYDLVTKSYAEHPGLIVALTVCRFTNAPEVIEAVRDCLVPFDAERFVATMQERDARGLPLERRAYIIPGGVKGELKAYSLTRDLFVPLAGALDAICPREGDTCESVFQRLRQFRYLNEGFITAQIIRDLKQVEPLRSAPDWKTFVWPGPGSQRGLNRIMGATTEAAIDHKRPEAEWHAILEEVVEVAAPQVDAELDDQDWQNLLCETDKFLRYRGGDLRGARRFVPHGEKPARKPKRKPHKTKPAVVPIKPAAPVEPAPHALPGLAAARDPSAGHILFHDVETRSAVDLRRVGAHCYAADPSTEILCLAYAVDNEPVQLWTPSDPVPIEFIEAARNPNWAAVAHHASFELTVAHHVLGPRHHFPAIPLAQWCCTMAMALAAALPAALEKAAEVLALSHRKDKAGAALMQRMSKPLPGGGWIEDAASVEKLYAYCRQDVEVERDLFRALPLLTDDEHELWQLDAVINARGFCVDDELLEAARRLVTKTEQDLQAEFHSITGLKTTNQIDKFITWLGERGCEVKDLRKATVSQALRRKSLEPEIKRAIELRRQLAHASAAKIKALRSWRSEDGRVHGAFRYHGAGTGRFTSHGVQVQNLKRDSEGVGEKIAAIMAGGVGLESPVEAVGDIARALICAAPRHRLLVADFSGIESRVLAWISGQQSKVDVWAKFDRTGDPADEPYDQIGRRCGLREKDARPVGKTIDLAFGFGGSIGAFKRAAPEDDETEDAMIKRYQQTWRADHPETVKFWYALDRAALGAVRNPGQEFPVRQVSFRYDEPFLRLRLPSGRSISYPSAEIAGMDKFGRPQLTFLDNAGGRFEPCRHGNGAWFGLLIENLVQGIARDLLAAAMLRLEAASYPVVLHVHDELVCEVPTGFGDLKEFRTIVEAVPDWAKGLPVRAKARESLRFAKEDAGTPSADVNEPTEAGIDVDDDGAGDGDHDDGTDNRREKAPPWSNGGEAGAEPLGAESEAPHGAPRPQPPPGPREDEAPKDEGPKHNGQDQSAQHAGADKRFSGNYGERGADGPYRPIKVRLEARGYELTHQFSYMLPGATEPLYIEDRYELKPGLAPTKDRPRKTCRYWHQAANGKGLNGTGPRRIVYHWPAIIAAGPGAIVYITEGANKSKPLNDAGLLATTVAYHQWTAECVVALAGLHLVYLEDHAPENGGDPAHKFAADAREKLASGAASFRIVPALNLWKSLGRDGEPSQGWDVKDWLEAGGDPAKLLEICNEVPAEGGELDEWDAGDLLCSGLPTPRQWLYGRQLCRRFLSSLVAPGDVGKTTMRLTQAIELATGRELLGHRIYQRCRVLIVSLEDDREELWRRLLAICKHHGVNPSEFKGWLFCRDLVDAKLVEEIRGERRLGTLEQMLRKAIERRHPDLVILDPFVKLHALDENKNPDMDFVCSQLIKLAQDYDIVVDSPAHARKGQLVAGDSDNRRGASAQRDAGRLDYTLTAMSETEAKQFGIDPDVRKCYVRLDRAKANIVRAIRATWYQLVNVALGNATALYPEGDEVQAIEVWVPPDIWIGLDAAVINQIVDKIDAGFPDGNRYSGAPTAKKRAAWKVVVEVVPTKTEAEAREIIKGWLKSGLLVVRKYKTPPPDSKEAEGLEVDPTKRPST